MKSCLIATFGSLVGSLRIQGSDGVVGWDIQRRHASEGLGRLLARSDTVEEVLTNERIIGGYFANCSVGSPPQNVRLQLDTGSSDIWVPDSRANICRQTGDRGCLFGSFAPHLSRSYRTVGEDQFSIRYLDRSSAKGDYFADSFEFGGVTVENMTMGLGVSSDISYGVAGIGYAISEAIVRYRSAASAYYNLPLRMIDAGLIRTAAYSLWLNDLDSNTGSILFGGIDTAKYFGDLTRIRIYPNSKGFYTSFLVALTSVQASSPSGSDGLSSSKFPIPVVLDSGTTLSFLPSDLVQQIWKEAGVTWLSDVGMGVLPCKLAESKGYFTFGFAGPDGPRIDIRMDELVIPAGDGRFSVFSTGPYQGEAGCLFGIQNTSSLPGILGDTFLRSTYVVYDLSNNELAMAATNFNSTRSDIVPFPSLSATIPSATEARNQDSITLRPAVTKPSNAAAAGFMDGTGIHPGNGAVGARPTFGLASVAVVGSMLLMCLISESCIQR